MNRRVLKVSLAAFALTALGACGDEALPNLPNDTTVNTDAVQTDITPDTTVPTSDTGPSDTNVPTPDTITGTDTSPAPDTNVGPDTALPPDETPPTVISSNPAPLASGVAIPFTVSVTFSEGIAANTLAPQTFKVLDPNDDPLTGTIALSDDGLTATFTVTADQVGLQPASPYTVWVAGGIVSDLAGNKLQENHSFEFYTADYPNVDGYAALAAKYAPTLDAAVQPNVGASKYQVPVAFDADGNWSGSDNLSWIKTTATSLSPTVYYDVIESESHYFIHYLFFFPYVNDPNVIYAHGNGAAGAMVVVQKAMGAAPEHPVGVTTVFKKGQYEEHMAYVTSESWIQGPKGLAFYQLMGKYAEATLFPEGRVTLFITAGKHEACLALEKGLSGMCEYELPYSLTFAYTDGSSDPIAKDGAVWPKDMSELPGAPTALGYSLTPLSTTLWARRQLVSPDGIWGGTFTYDAPLDTPGYALKVPSSFVDPLDDNDAAFGRPVWAWRFNPTQGNVPSVIHGQIGIDPAGYYLKMHGSKDKDTALIPFDPVTGVGFSTDYCFNPYLHIDLRQAPSCQPK